MRTVIESLIALPHVDSITLHNEIVFIESSLETLRSDDAITNDAYLAAGAVQGGISMIRNMLDAGISRDEVQTHLRDLLIRAIKLDEEHPELDGAINSRR
jgi:hypothetical protein